MYNILLINPSKAFYKKDVDGAINAKHLNFGILSIASLFPQSITIYDCQWKDNEVIKCEISKIIKEKRTELVGISLISAYSEKCAFYIAQVIHNDFPEVNIIYGGKDHAPYIAKDLLDLYHAKAVIKTEGESFFNNLLKNDRRIHDCPGVIYKDINGKIIETDDEPNYIDIPSYDHSLYPNHLDYVPSIEISRGCNKECLFCTNNKSIQRQKNTDDIIREIEILKSTYGHEFCAYFQTPHFLLSKKELLKIIGYRNRKDRFTWRTQTSVNYLSEEHIKLLYAAGARAIDVGFESASLSMLQRMEKTKSPTEYLHQMKVALSIAADVGLRLKLNILLFAGETPETLLETANFLKDNLLSFHSFSAYPVMIYPGPRSEFFVSKIKSEFGGETYALPGSKSIQAVNLSPLINYEKALKIALLLGKSYQSSDMYLSQRRIGYLPHGYSLDSKNLPLEKLPFYSSESERTQAQETLQNILEGMK
ncbi:B12-binding domain-containing radical SAM protein [Desulfocurvibacter africanus]|uniref:Radical SAM domain protein n=1 Tax=Desulfocurvibacter africanus subsp. africanus str. Walvis Bay TaxID=690850 RepID=F3Z3D5_DESAF|nr:radical SAM protein [Desulfocurvibacter africanus]EGJ51475.1 Radical SAM domain protein [Desulfocurvibacter africanus subsp. africanus str. Walvis Bay]